MSLSQLGRPIMAALQSSRMPCAGSLLSLPLRPAALAPCRIESSGILVGGRRYASVKAQGQYKFKPKRTHPKKLGAKRTGDQFVLPGNIIFKQFGTHWWPGENCIMGRDFTIHSQVSGYVKYYRDPARHPDRKYIGVTFEKEDTLPYPQHAERKRRLNMVAVPIPTPPVAPTHSPSGLPLAVERKSPHQGGPPRLLRLRDDYSYREDNWRIGRLVETTGLQTQRYKSRRAYFRHRRWARERDLGRLKRMRQRMAETGSSEGDEWLSKAKAVAGGKKAAKKAKKPKAAKVAGKKR